MGRKKQTQVLSGPQEIIIGRFVYDVLTYTLPMCGFDELDDLDIGVIENQYKRRNVVEIAGYSALRLALIMRGKWKRMFESRLKASGFTEEDTGPFMLRIVEICTLSRDSPLQTKVEAMLALTGEILLFFQSENVDVDSKSVIATATIYISHKFKFETNYLEKLENIFDKFNNIGAQVKSITKFMNKFAIPYGSRSDVSDLFYEEIKGCLFEEFKKVTVASPVEEEDPSIVMAGAAGTSGSKESSLKDLKDRLGFLPHDLFSAIVAEESVSVPQDLMLASGSTLPGNRVSPEPSNMPPSPEKGGATERRNLRSRKKTRSTKTSEEFRPVVPIGPPEVQAGSGSGVVEEKKGRGRRLTGSKKTPEETLPLLKKLEPDEPPESFAGGGTTEKKSGKARIGSRKGSKQTPQIQPSSVDSTEVGIEDEFRHLGTEAVSQRSQGAIPKKRRPKK